jgi:chromosome segregation ATPase
MKMKMATKKKMTRGRPKATEQSVGVTGVALVASILGNLKFYGDNEELRSTVETLQRLVQDWQGAYNTLDAQLALALRTNDELNRLIVSLRHQVRRAQARANEAEVRALAMEARQSRSLREHDSRIDE